MSAAFPEPGDVFEERYRIQSQIGSGGFARIYHAVHENLARDVALKILKPKPFEDLDPDRREMYDAQFVERFQREARNIAQLRDAHTVTLYDFGQTDDGFFYMVFEYINGDTLAEIARRDPPLAPRRTVKILRGVLSSLHEAHAVGILHRDIKPGNIMVYEHVGRSDQVKVLDFGISKAMLGGSDLTLQDLTRQDAMVGTPHYISPEQLRGGDPGPESDLYSLGMVAFELVTGKRAIGHVGTIDVINRQISPQPIVLPEECRAPRNLRATIQRMLAKEPDQRFESARAVRDALEHWDADYDLEWTPRWLDPPSGPLQSDEDRDLEELPVGEVADQQYRTDAGEEIDQVTRPMSETQRLAGDEGDRQTRPAGRPGDRYKQLAAVALGAFVLPILAYAGYTLLEGSDPGREVKGAAASAGPGSANAEDASAVPETFVVETDPPGAHVKVGHRAVGESPVELRRHHFSFPTSVRAELPDGRRLVRTVHRPDGAIVFDFSDMVPDDPPPPAVPDTGPRPRAAESESGSRSDTGAPGRNAREKPSARTAPPGRTDDAPP